MPFLRVRDLMTLCIDRHPDDIVEIPVGNNQSVRITDLSGAARGLHPGIAYLETSKPLALAPPPATDDVPTCFCAGGAFAAEFGEEMAAMCREGVSR